MILCVVDYGRIFHWSFAIALSKYPWYLWPGFVVKLSSLSYDDWKHVIPASLGMTSLFGILWRFWIAKSTYLYLNETINHANVTQRTDLIDANSSTYTCHREIAWLSSPIPCTPIHTWHTKSRRHPVVEDKARKALFGRRPLQRPSQRPERMLLQRQIHIFTLM